MQTNTILTVVFAAFLAGLLGFAYGTVWNSGCAALAPAGAVGGCAEFVLYRYQAVLGIGGAVAAAMVAARPVWRQLAEMARQSDGQTLEYLRRRSVELDREQSLISEITSSIQNCLDGLVLLASTRQYPGGLFPPQVAQFKSLETYMNDKIMKFDHELGPMWGAVSIHKARIRLKEDAQRLCALQDFDFEAGEFVYQGIIKERDAVGNNIAELEAKLSPRSMSVPKS
jgi:hypothetical protein